MAGSIYILSGISGSGKSTISDLLIERHPNIARSITLTTRKPREGELFGFHYYFTSPEIFSWLQETNQLLEFTQVYGDTFYGTLKVSVEKLITAGRDVLFVVDSRGVDQVTEHFPNARSLFLKAPSDDEQRKRLEGRGTTGNDLEIRVAKAHEELIWAEKKGLPVVVNDSLHVALSEVERIFFA
ncbi:MAG: guanylate kinase [bacterium]